MGTQKTAVAKIDWLVEYLKRNAGKEISKEVIISKMMISNACNKRYAKELVEAFLTAKSYGIREDEGIVKIPSDL